MNEELNPQHGAPDFQRVFGVVLLLGAVGTVFFMAHHPTSLTQLSGIAGIVHGAMLIMLLLLATGFSHFAAALGLRQPLMLIGLTAYLASSIFNALAAVINGFVSPALATKQGDSISHDIFDLTWEANQAFARLAVIATGLAYGLWSAQLLRHRHYWIAVAGFIAGSSPLLMLWNSAGSMHVQTAMVVYSIQVGWAALVGIFIYRTGSR